MILNSAPQNEAILSNVGEIGEFRIRNSAKAFNILSSGLYANKIRAIIRELSCNAVDSHVAAGRGEVPFDLHLPTVLEPHFSIRDYGTGLSHDQVTSIYTTYFESTKTGSNDFIGALGLGSKSPFSYTDNFTVTAIKDGRKGIYSAFINAEGVPSIAMMMEEQTDEAPGVEVKFSVNEKNDFYRFREESKNVYRYFDVKPNLTGDTVTFESIDYLNRDLIPGVHVFRDHYRTSVAVMGNIAYPIEVPNADQLGDVRNILKNGVELHFNIGELDFQASREGLSYIPQTIDAIKRKLEQVRDALTLVVEEEMNAIDNLWEKTYALRKKRNHPLFESAVVEYVRKHNIPTVNPTATHWSFIKSFDFEEKELAEKYNILVRKFSYNPNTNRCTTEKIEHRWENGTDKRVRIDYHVFHADELGMFVVNDTNIGVTERAKHHYRETVKEAARVTILERADKTKEMNTKQFFADIYNPPAKQIMMGSQLAQKPREQSITRNVSIIKMVDDYRNRGRGNFTWEPAGSLSTFDKTVTHYYIPLKGYETIGKVPAKELQFALDNCEIPGVKGIKLYGVRKSDIEVVKTQNNWVNIEEHLEKVLSTPSEQFEMMIARTKMSLPEVMYDTHYSMNINNSIQASNDDSPYNKFMAKLRKFGKINPKASEGTDKIVRQYGKTTSYDPTVAAQKIVYEYNDVMNRYPLIRKLTRVYDLEAVKAVEEYIDLIDQTKGV